MTNEEIKELLQILKESGVSELELQRGSDRLRIIRFRENPKITASSPPVQADSATASTDYIPDSSHATVASPIAGIFYDSPTPGAAAFVKVGDHVDVGQVLCIIESMKLMNEIEAEVAGIIAAKFAENGRPVEHGEALFAIHSI